MGTKKNTITFTGNPQEVWQGRSTSAVSIFKLLQQHSFMYGNIKPWQYKLWCPVVYSQSWFSRVPQFAPLKLNVASNIVLPVQHNCQKKFWQSTSLKNNGYVRTLCSLGSISNCSHRFSLRQRCPYSLFRFIGWLYWGLLQNIQWCYAYKCWNSHCNFNQIPVPLTMIIVNVFVFCRNVNCQKCIMLPGLVSPQAGMFTLHRSTIQRGHEC